jgi:uncharacterized membrane protein YuzA (DUF378 family)
VSPIDPKDAPPPSAPVQFQHKAPIDSFRLLLSAVFAVIFLGMGARAIQFLVATVSGKDFPTGLQWTDGRPVKYFEIQGFAAITEIGLCIVGLVLLLDVLATIVRRRPLSRVVMVLAGFAIAWNLFVCFKCFTATPSLFPIVSIVAAAIAGFTLLELARDGKPMPVPQQ